MWYAAYVCKPTRELRSTVQIALEIAASTRPVLYLSYGLTAVPSQVYITLTATGQPR